MKRILAVDPGQKRIGIALSDPTQTIASPLTVMDHKSREIDASKILQIALDNQVELIIVGYALDDNNQPTLEGRRSRRLAAQIRHHGTIPVELWDETDSTVLARMSRIELGLSRKKRSGHLDDLAAAVILQSYLDSRHPS